MKKHFTIEVDIDTERTTTTGSVSGGFVQGFTARPDLWLVNIEKDSPGQPHDIPSILAHELGHVVGEALGMPGAANNPINRPEDRQRILNRSMFSRWPIYTIEEQRRVLASEREAWDLAAQMIPVDPATREYALQTYIDNLAVLERGERHGW